MSIIKLHMQSSSGREEGEYVLRDLGEDPVTVAASPGEEGVIADVKVFEDIELTVPQPLSPALKDFLKSPAASDLDIGGLLESLT